MEAAAKVSNLRFDPFLASGGPVCPLHNQFAAARGWGTAEDFGDSALLFGQHYSIAAEPGSCQ